MVDTSVLKTNYYFLFNILYFTNISIHPILFLLKKTKATFLFLFCWIIHVAEVIVVYCWELSSKNLEEGYLYAPKLGSVSKVPRLIELSSKNSVYSIYKHFNQHQKSAYQRKLKELEDFIKWFLVPNIMWGSYFTLLIWDF